jgi:hypothetical protein
MSTLKSPNQAQLNHSLELEKLKGGKVGQWFGVGENLRTSVMAITAIIVIVPGIVLLFISFENGLDYLKWAAPIFTLALGYIAGEKRSS